MILHQERTLVDRIAPRRLTWFGRVSKMGSARLPLPVKLVHCSVIGRKKINQGRQPKKWTKNINEDMDTKKIMQVDEAMTTVNTRVKQRRLKAASSSFS